MPRLLFLILAVGLLTGGGKAAGDGGDRLRPLKEIAFSDLSDRTIAEAGRQALAMRPEAWKHAETEHFVLHFRERSVAAPVAVEAEFYYRILLSDLKLSPTPSDGKSHIYLFDDPREWSLFASDASLEVWTGAAKIGGELFVPRDSARRFKGHELGHEIAHLIVRRHLGEHLPLWLEEGYAEEVATRGYAAFYRARGYRAKPRAGALPAPPVPLAELTARTGYPADTAEAHLFYRQAHRLAWFLNAFGDEAHFRQLLTLCAKGEPFESALRRAYGSRWASLDALEVDFLAELARP
ncbi:MAG TPA: hypothetical protein VNQ90_17405 [Chthoniobacteraceae bacterium]|nr:hypothetical protein [Chthoniobacteraceae bacterium]